MTTGPKKPHRDSSKKIEQEIDESGEESFPASDPPAFAGGAHSVGAPVDRKARPKRKPA